MQKRACVMLECSFLTRRWRRRRLCVPLLKIVFLKRKRYKWGRNEYWSSKSLMGGGKNVGNPLGVKQRSSLKMKDVTPLNTFIKYEEPLTAAGREKVSPHFLQTAKRQRLEPIKWVISYLKYSLQLWVHWFYSSCAEILRRRRGGSRLRNHFSRWLSHLNMPEAADCSKDTDRFNACCARPQAKPRSGKSGTCLWRRFTFSSREARDESPERGGEGKNQHDP